MARYYEKHNCSRVKYIEVALEYNVNYKKWLDIMKSIIVLEE